MSKAIRIYKTGSSDEMKWEDVDVGTPGAGQIRIRHTAVGLNFLDVYQRSGMYAGDKFPVILGNEGAGVRRNKYMAVRPFSIIAAAVWSSTPSGVFTTCEASIRRSSA